MERIDEFKNELRLRNYAYSTVLNYTSNLKLIFSKIGEHPSVPEIKHFLLTRKSVSDHKQMVGTLRCYFEFVLKEKLSLKDIPYPRKEYRLPKVLSVSEVKTIFDQCKNIKHRAIISLLYGCGMRVGEVLALKPEDIDSERMIITIRQGKGNKDRQVMLDPALLKLLREYYSQYKPKEFLFNGQFGNVYSSYSINQFLKYYANRAGIKKNVHAHIFRHSFATHLLENGTDISIIQRLLGHVNPKTTLVYTHIGTSLISKTKSPLHLLNQN